MRLILASILLSLLACTQFGQASSKKPLVIAVIDTGFGYNDKGHEAHLCNYGHKDFSVDRFFTKNYVTKDLVPVDVLGHGTNVVGLIERELKGETNYCIVILKFYSEDQDGPVNLAATVLAFKYAKEIKADIVNYSGGGKYPNDIEKAAVISYLNSGGKLIAAAGNESQDLDDKKNTYFPAEYDDKIVVVGNVDSEGNRQSLSNYGKRVNRVENGFEQQAYGLTMTGTSQATAVVTGKIAKEMLNVRR